MDKVYVYFIQKGRGNFKIGVSKDPETRLRELQTANSGELHIIAKIVCDSRMQALDTEHYLHTKLAPFRLKGEWFKRGALFMFKYRAILFPHRFSSGGYNIDCIAPQLPLDKARKIIKFRPKMLGIKWKRFNHIQREYSGKLAPIQPVLS